MARGCGPEKRPLEPDLVGASVGKARGPLAIAPGAPRWPAFPCPPSDTTRPRPPRARRPAASPTARTSAGRSPSARRTPPGCRSRRRRPPGTSSPKAGPATKRRASPSHPRASSPITQLEHARLGTVTPEMLRVAEREPHLTAEQVRDEIAAGRMVIPANRVHLGYRLDPMAIGRASKTKVNANMGASPISSGTDAEVEKLRWAEKWQRRHGDGPLDRRRPRRHPRSDHPELDRADRHGAHLLDDHRHRKIEDLDARATSWACSSTRRSRASTTSRSTPACCRSTCPSSPSG